MELATLLQKGKGQRVYLDLHVELQREDRQVIRVFRGNSEPECDRMKQPEDQYWPNWRHSALPNKFQVAACSFHSCWRLSFIGRPPILYKTLIRENTLFAMASSTSYIHTNGTTNGITNGDSKMAKLALPQSHQDVSQGAFELPCYQD